MRFERRLKIFAWNVHGGYLNALVKTGHDFYIPVKKNRPYNYDGKTPGYVWPKNVHQVQTNQVKKLKLDLLIFQTPQQIIEEQFKVLSAKQRQLPKIFIFHTPPKEKMKVNNKLKILMSEVKVFVHITNYNFKKWNTPSFKSRVIYHGIEIDKKVKWMGNIKKSVTAINNFSHRPHCGYDLWRKVTKKVPNVLIGNKSETIGGIGVIQNKFLRKEFAKYRVYFNPTIHSSIPMTMLEAMSVGLPVVTTASTEIPKIIKNGLNGFISNKPGVLIQKLNLLISDKLLAQKLGQAAQQTIKEEFSIRRFTKEWNNLFVKVLKNLPPTAPSAEQTKT